MISLIVAISKNNVIGNKGNLPWHYPEDLQYFKKTTLNKTVVMGKNTFTSIIERLGKPLPNRKCVVVTRNLDFNYDGVEVIHDLKAYLEKSHDEEIFIIGGKQIYEQSLPYVDKLYITFINQDYPGDTYFPDLDYSQFELISKKDSKILSFWVFQRKV